TTTHTYDEDGIVNRLDVSGLIDYTIEQSGGVQAISIHHTGEPDRDRLVFTSERDTSKLISPRTTKTNYCHQVNRTNSDSSTAANLRYYQTYYQYTPDGRVERETQFSVNVQDTDIDNIQAIDYTKVDGTDLNSLEDIAIKYTKIYKDSDITYENQENNDFNIRDWEQENLYPLEPIQHVATKKWKVGDRIYLEDDVQMLSRDTLGRVCEDRTRAWVNDGALRYRDNLKYAYDSAGRLREEDVFSESFQYHIDGEGTLDREYSREYRYDGLGNLTRIRQGIQNEATYEYDKDRLIAYNTYVDGEISDTKHFQYDQYGYPTHYKVSSLDSQPNMTWDMGRLTRYGDVTYKYDTSGIRLEKTSGGVSKRYITGGERVLAEYWSDGTKVYYTYDNVGPNMLLLIRPKQGANASASSAEFEAMPYYLKRDAHGNITEIFNSDGTCRGMYQYDAWGNCSVFDGDGKPLDYSTDSDNIAFINPFRYRGYCYDDETGLYYLNARYYDPETRRFISPDTYDYLDQTSTYGLNLYLYCANDPINYADPSGHLPEWAWKLIIGTSFILVGALVTAVTAGAGTAFWAAFGSALLTSTIQVGISTAVSAGLGFIAGGLSTGTWEGAFTGMLDGVVDGYMWGGIISGGSQILSGLMKVGNGISAGRVDALYKSENSTTLFNYNNAAGKSRFRIDVAKGKVKYPGGKTGFLSGKELNGLHYHFGKSNSLRALHRFFTPGIVNGFISSGLGYFF
ncbi:MAG: RHS repeat-associated core domain-containing protein, partial [Paludibacteraceae bacterium]|nr:RHS repeat-associated core domain-containing protein [Paludibacteraceae bacterium]